MVVVEFAYRDMKKLVDLPREKMAALLSELGAPSEIEPEVDKIISELTPNRPDWYSMEGLARALKAYHGLGRSDYKVRKSAYRVIVEPSVAPIRPFTVCAVVKGLRFDDRKIKDMVLLQEKLLATLGRKVKKFGLGLYPLHAIRFPVRYTAMRPEEIRYIPLGSDREMSANEILGEHKKGQQYGHLIRGRGWYPVFVDADGKIMALIPVVNSAETGRVDETTEDIFIEVTGIEINACKAALNILVCTFADMGGEIYEVSMEYGQDRFRSPDLAPKVMDFDLEKANRILGTRIEEKEAARLLERMDYVYRKGKVQIAPYRADVLGFVDVVEDLAIAYGYNNFRPTTPNFFSPGSAIRRYDALDAIMRGMGFLEIKTFILTNKEKAGLAEKLGGIAEIENPGTVDYTIIRPSLVVDMLETFSINKMKGLPQRFYEIGIVQRGKNHEKRLVFGLMDKKIDFSDARGVLQTLATEQGIRFSLEKGDSMVFQPELSCTIISEGKAIGVFGKARREVLEKFGLGFDVYICELVV